MGRSVAARFQVPAANLQAAGAARRRGQVGAGERVRKSMRMAMLMMWAPDDAKCIYIHVCMYMHTYIYM